MRDRLLVVSFVQRSGTDRLEVIYRSLLHGGSSDQSRSENCLAYIGVGSKDLVDAQISEQERHSGEMDVS